MVKVGVERIPFNAIHFTLESGGECSNLHGHTYIVDVEVEGAVSEEDGMVLDFLVLKEIVKEVLSSWDHSIILPERFRGKVRIEGPFNLKFKYIKYPHATTEYIAKSICEELREKLNLKLKVKVYEGLDKYVETIC